MTKLLALILLLLPATAPADEHALRVEAIERGLALVQKAARNYPDHRDCFSCHHQTLPMLAMVSAREKSITIDHALLKEQAAFTIEFYQSRIDAMKQGKGVGGRGTTAGYALWALRLADEEKNDVADALVAYLLNSQQPEGNWQVQTRRPPMEETNFTPTALAAIQLKHFSKDPSAKASIERAVGWIAQQATTSQEAHNFRLLAASRMGAPEQDIARLRSRILSAQNEDGGWSQTDTMASDAYATGQTLYVLQQTGAEGDAISRGVTFLLETQKADGSWHVKSRSKPIQRMFDNGDPHGKDQFISTPATAWAVAALAGSLQGD